MLSETRNELSQSTNSDEELGRNHVWQKEITDFFKNLEFYKNLTNEKSY